MLEQKEYLKTALQEFHITLQDKQLDQLLTFYDLLVEKNKVMNLTAITEFEEVVFKHFLDSLAICKVSFDGKTSMFQALTPIRPLIASARLAVASIAASSTESCGESNELCHDANTLSTISHSSQSSCME